MEKRIKVDFCQEILYITEKDIPKYQAKVKNLQEISIRAGYTESQAKSEFYLKILKGDQ